MKDYDVYFDCIFVGKQEPSQYKYRLKANNKEDAIECFENIIRNSFGLLKTQSQKSENADKRYVINLNNVCCYKIYNSLEIV
ncbi:MAG: hypothetical protein ACTTJ6_00965 [Treponema sp.]